MAKLFTYKILIASFAIAAVYVILTIYLMNFRLVRDTILGDYPLTYKGTLLFELLGGMWTSMTLQGLSLVVANAVLTGLNASLFASRVKALKTQGGMRLVVGGSSLLGIVGSGCASCGLPVLALLGLGSSFTFLPLRGVEFSYLSVGLLTLSLYLLIRTKKQQVCQVENKSLSLNMNKS